MLFLCDIFQLITPLILIIPYLKFNHYLGNEHYVLGHYSACIHISTSD